MNGSTAADQTQISEADEQPPPYDIAIKHNNNDVEFSTVWPIQKRYTSYIYIFKWRMSLYLHAHLYQIFICNIFIHSGTKMPISYKPYEWLNILTTALCHE